MHFDSTCEFITHSIQAEGRLLIQCDDGISVAPAIVAAYLMKQHGVQPCLTLFQRWFGPALTNAVSTLF